MLEETYSVRKRKEARLSLRQRGRTKYDLATIQNADNLISRCPVGPDLQKLYSR